MGRFLALRILGGLLTVLGVLFITFLLLYLLPSDPARILAGPHASAEQVARLRRQMGFDRPLWMQFAGYVSRLLRGHLGTSLTTGRSVARLLWERLPATAYLAFWAVLVEVAVGVPLGLLAAREQRETWVLLVSALGVAVPTFVWGDALLALLGFRWSVLPLGGFGGYGIGGLRYVVLPALTAGIGGAATIVRILSENLRRTAEAPFLRTAAAKGLPPWRILIRHRLPVALLPVVTQLGMDMGNFLGGLVVTEEVFSWPGLGSLTVHALAHLDVPVLLGVTQLGAVLVVASGILTDLLVWVLDPRLRQADRSA